ncbi:isoprenylcysteine carboxylmethyltransferase family protein [Comamonadaceae bacterium M7527]|nr:isoprenylcysteine carboxylmethyltransferase family protein [Comamonadaceae bacterium M7527]
MRTTLVPPPVVTLLSAWAMWGVAGLPTWARLALVPSAWGWQHMVAVVLWLLALVLMATALWTMRGLRTTPNPVMPERASALVQHSVFAYSRNPIYVADVVVLVAWASWLHSAAALLVLPFFVVYISVMQIRAEEQALAAAFGDLYAQYCARVRRWL